jgi:hypothetical protein
MTNLPPIIPPEYLSSKDYFYAFVSALAGVVLGILWSEFQFWRKARNHRKAVRQGFLDAFADVSRLVTQAIGQLEDVQAGRQNPVGGIPNYTLDSLALVRLLERADGALPHSVLREIDGLRYQIGHIENKMQMLYSIAANSGSHTAVAHHEFASVLAHLKMAVGWISQRKGDVEKAG